MVTILIGTGTPVCDVLSNHTIEPDSFNSQRPSIQVFGHCGRLPLVPAIAGSMPVVKEKGSTTGPWQELINLFEKVARMMRVRGEAVIISQYGR